MSLSWKMLRPKCTVVNLRETTTILSSFRILFDRLKFGVIRLNSKSIAKKGAFIISRNCISGLELRRIEFLQTLILPLIHLKIANRDSVGLYPILNLERICSVRDRMYLLVNDINLWIFKLKNNSGFI